MPETETTAKRGEISSASRRESGTTYFPYIFGQEQDYENHFTFTFSAWRRGLRRPGAAGSPVGCGTGKTDGTQMDAVTAGAVAVGMGAFAIAEGSNTHTYTSTSTTVISTPRNNVEIGRAFGKAVACCGSNSGTDVQAAYYAEGDKVIAHSNVHDHRTPMFSFSQGLITVIVVDVPSN